MVQRTSVEEREIVVLRRHIRSRKRRVAGSAGTMPEPTSLLTATTRRGGDDQGSDRAGMLVSTWSARDRADQTATASMVRGSQRVRESMGSGGAGGPGSGGGGMGLGRAPVAG